MPAPWKTFAAFIALALAGAGGFAAESLAPGEKPWEGQSFSVETGVLWQAGRLTPLAYRLVPTQLSWRSRAPIQRQWGDRRFVIRNRVTLFTTWIQQGPESHYVALDGSPSLELWNARGTWCWFGGAGGGVGVLDSRGVRGGQGQDLTYNWFARGGVELRTKKGFSVIGAIMFQHMSNRGATTPNPGIDAVGFNFGGSWSF